MWLDNQLDVSRKRVVDNLRRLRVRVDLKIMSLILLVSSGREASQGLSKKVEISMEVELSL